MSFIDVAIIGGGPAGLTAAGTLARQLHTAVVFDAGRYRNARAAHMHMVPGWDHQHPRDFRQAARRDLLARYAGISFADVGVETIEKRSDAHFRVTDAEGRVRDFRKILLAVGSEDIFPDIEGYQDLWGERIFHCLFCHGFEERGEDSAGILAVEPLTIPAVVIHVAENAAQLAKRVTLYTHGDEKLAAGLGAIASDTFRIEPRRIARVRREGDAVHVEFAEGEKRQEAFLMHSPQTKTQGPFAQQLGLAMTPAGDVVADAPLYPTSVRGVFAAGDCVTPYKVTPGAISSGCNAAVGVSAQLQAEKHGHAPMF